MGKFMITIGVVVCMLPAMAQSVRGVCGYVSAGVAGHFSPSVQQSLRSQALLGMNFRFNRMAVVVGGDALLLLQNRMLIGGSLGAYRASGETNRGHASLLMGNGFLKVGYLVSSTNRTLSFPFLGAGINITMLRLRNDLPDGQFVLHNTVIGPGSLKRLSCRGVNFDAGYTIQFLTGARKDRRNLKGILVGTQVGALIFAGLEDWQETSAQEHVPSVAQLLSFSPYLRITLGIGSFHVKTFRRVNKINTYRF